ncbi:hypothetical protein ACI65C_000895 [Semiaphis heraclei]
MNKNNLKSAKLKNKNKNFTKDQLICEELLTHKPTDLNVMLRNAKSFFNCGNFEKCIDCLERAKNINPNCCEVLNNLALVYLKKSEIEKAKEYLFKACVLKPYCVDTWKNYADLLYNINDLNSAELAYGRVLSLKPELYKFKIAQNSAAERSEALNNLGDVYYMSGKFKKAIPYYQKALEINSDLNNTYISLGLAFLKVKELLKAAKYFKKALILEPENVFVLRNLAVTYWHQDNMILSVDEFKKCLKLQPENIDFNFDLAMIYLRDLKNYQEAIIYLKKCIQLNPERKYLYTSLLAAYWMSKDYLNTSDTCMSLGELYLEDDDQENARNAFTRAIYWNPENAYGHWKVGLIMYKLGYFDLALNRYKKAIELKPNLVSVYCDIAIIYEVKGLFERAMDNYKMTIQLEPDHLNALYNLAYLKQKLDQIDEEIVDIYQRILQIDEAEAFDIHKNLADIFKTKGNFTDALMHYTKALEYDSKCVKMYIQMGNMSM